MSDQELISRLRSNDRQAFKELVQANQDRVIHTCYGFVMEEEDARDLAQEVFVEVFLSLRHFREDSRLSTWIYRIAVNKSLDYLKRKNRKKRFAFVQRTSQITPGEEKILSASVVSPDQQYEQKERRALLMDLMGKLPENQRIALTLFHLEGLSQTEIAAIMKTSVGAVESLLFRGKENVRRRIKKTE